MSSNRQTDIWLILGSATLPFVAKIAVLFTGHIGYIAQSLYKVFQLVIPAVWRYKQNGKRGLRIIWPVDEPMPSWQVWGVATLIAISLSAAAIAALQLLIPLWELDPVTIRQGYDQRFAVSPLGAIAVVIFLSFANSALEELHFRVWLNGELSKLIGDKWGITISAVAFGSMHGLIFFGLPDFPLTLIAIASIALIGAGACWSLLMRKSGGIHAAWWSHGLTDALLLGWGLHWLGYV